MKLLGLSTFAVLLCEVAVAAGATPHDALQSPDSRPPNVIFILADDLGYGDYSASEEVNRTNAIPTPNIQALAEAGAKFVRGYSGQVCAPSRCALMTGRHTGHCTVRGNDGSYSPLQPTDFTVARVLKEQKNYTTALFGKWGLGDYNTTGYPLEQGFDVFVGQDSQVACHNWWPNVIQNGTDGACPLPSNDFHNNGAHCILPNNTACTWMNDLVATETLAFLRAHQQQPDPPPFFIYLSTTTPHVGNLAGVKSDYPTPYVYYGPFANESWSDNLKHFAGAVWAQDQIVGAVRAELESLGIENDTMVFFSGDNGPDNHDFTVFDDTGPFRGKKRSLHEGGIRQTILAAWPGTVVPNQTLTELFVFYDLLATAADAAGVPSDALPAHDGVSLMPALLGGDTHAQGSGGGDGGRGVGSNAGTSTGSGGDPKTRYLYWEFCDYSPVNGLLPQVYAGGWVQAVRFDAAALALGTVHQWKAIRSNRDNATVLLFDLEEDQSESHDLAAANPGVVAQACAYMDEAHVETPVWKSSYNASDRCCTSCFQHQGCPYPCMQYPS